MSEQKRERMMVIGVPKVTASLISELYGKRTPYEGIFLGRTATAEAENRGRYNNPYHKFLGEFSCIVKDPKDGKTKNFRANVAIFPGCVEGALLNMLRDADGAVVEFAFKVKCDTHPTKPSLSMWTYEPLLQQDDQNDRLGQLLLEATRNAAQPAA